MSTLTQAFSQWSNRPADERYTSLEALHAACVWRKEHARTATVQLREMAAIADGDAVRLQGKMSGRAADFTHHSFGQLCRRIDAPPEYLRELPAELAVKNLNHGLAKVEDKGSKLLLQENGGFLLRAITGPDYTRIMDSDISGRLLRLANEHPEWQPAPEAFDGSRGLYASDRDMFAFMVNNNRRIFEQDPNGGLGRGFMVSNGECGDRSFWMMTFYYEYVCGNHRVWGASGVHEIRIRHIGDADERAFNELAIKLTEWSESPTTGETEKVVKARAHVLGKDKDAVLDALFGLRGIDVSKKLLAAAYDKAEERVDWYGAPNTAWGFTGGLTEVARDLPHADARTKVDRAAGRIMEMAF